MNTSATGGYLSPDGGTVPNDQTLEDILQEFIHSITGIAGENVRPRFQIIPPSIPEVGTDWVAFGVQNQQSDDGPYFSQNQENLKSVRHEDFEVLLSFYGNNGQHFAKLFIDGCAIPQNISQLKDHQIKYIGIGRVTTAPDLINEQYVHRFDVVANFRRKTARTYPILPLLDTSGINTQT